MNWLREYTYFQSNWGNQDNPFMKQDQHQNFTLWLRMVHKYSPNRETIGLGRTDKQFHLKISWTKSTGTDQGGNLWASEPEPETGEGLMWT